MTNLVEDRIGSVMLLTLHRPERLNALDAALLGALEAAIGRAVGDEAVRAVVITGAGGRAFCAGADVHELDGIDGESARDLMRRGQAAFDSIEAAPLPVIAAVNGVALGGGCELAMACDLRFAGRRGRFGQPEIRLANVPGWGGTQRLPQLIGRGRAVQMILGGDPIDAETATAWGLASEVVDDDKLQARAVAEADRLGARSPLAVALAKEAVAVGFRDGPEAGLRFEAESVARCCESQEQRLAVRQFFGRKTPAVGPAKGRTGDG